MDNFALTPAERALFQALTRRGVPFLASKRALNRAKDSAQLPALEATLLARDRSDSD